MPIVFYTQIATHGILNSEKFAASLLKSSLDNTMAVTDQDGNTVLATDLTITHQKDAVQVSYTVEATACVPDWIGAIIDQHLGNVGYAACVIPTPKAMPTKMVAPSE